ncbi:MAG: transposase [Acidobacteriota bacterium]
MKLIAAGGVEDHVHLLISLPKTVTTSKAMQLIKGGSSKWIHDTFPEHSLFEWQEGYGAFSISIKDKSNVVRYINNQPEHHKKQDFSLNSYRSSLAMRSNSMNAMCLINVDFSRPYRDFSQIDEIFPSDKSLGY